MYIILDTDPRPSAALEVLRASARKTLHVSPEKRGGYAASPCGPKYTRTHSHQLPFCRREFEVGSPYPDPYPDPYSDAFLLLLCRFVSVSLFSAAVWMLIFLWISIWQKINLVWGLRFWEVQTEKRLNSWSQRSYSFDFGQEILICLEVECLRPDIQMTT